MGHPGLGGGCWRAGVLGAVLLCAQGAQAAEALRLAVIDIGPPFAFMDGRGRPDGIMYELSKRLARQLDGPAVIQLLPYPRMLDGLGRGTLDCAIFFTTDERKKRFEQIGLLVKRQVLIVRRPQGARIGRLEDLHGKTVGHVRGTLYGAAFDNNAAITKYEVDGYQQGMAMLQAGRLDAFIGVREFLDEIYDMERDAFVFETREEWLQCSRASPRLLPGPSSTTSCAPRWPGCTTRTRARIR